MNRFQSDCLEILFRKAHAGAIDRRSFVKGASLLLALPLSLRTGVTMAQNKSLVVVNWGGDALKAFAEAWGNNFTEQTGIAVKLDGSGPTEGAVRAHAKGGRITWDVVDADAFTARILGSDGLLEPCDYSIVDRSKLRDGDAFTYGPPGYYYSYVIAWDTERFERAPAGAKDFFDIEAFPGMRTLYKWMNGMPEAALIADGVDPADLYPLDLERAFAKIEEIKPHVISFWASGAESQQLLLTGEAQLGYLWHTRAKVIGEDSDGRIDWTYADGFLTPSTWATLVDNPAGKESAMRFIAHTQDPASQIELLRLLGNGLANPAGDAMVPPDLERFNCASAENAAKQIRLDMEWYADNYSAALDRFLAVISA